MNVPVTVSGASAWKSRWRRMIHVLRAPSARAAVTNSCSRSESTTARTTRAASVQAKRPMTRTTISRPVPTMPTTIAMMISPGIARTASVVRMITVSTTPPNIPAIRPRIRPTPVATKAAASPTDSETRPA